MRVELKGHLPGPVFHIDPKHDVFITNHHAHVRDDGVAIPTAHGAQVEVAFGAIHVWMSEEEAEAFGKNLQTLSGVQDKLTLARQILTPGRMVLTAPEMASVVWAALENVIAYLEAQR
jgi:hypothetical protein